jgi:hypothetical protein
VGGIASNTSTYYSKWFYHKDKTHAVHITQYESSPYIVTLISVDGTDEGGHIKPEGVQKGDEFETFDEAKDYVWKLIKKND